jgi:hypothetical protein
MLRSVVTTCQVDGRPAVACGAGIPTTGLADGSHQVSVTATSLRGSATVSATFRVDGTPPSVATVRGPALVRTAPATVSSTATDADQVVSFQGRERVRDLGRGFSSWHPIPLPGMRGTTVVRLAPGQTRCIAARAHDAAGNVGPWGPRTCVSRMVDDSALQHTSGWHERTVAGAADGTALRAKRQGEKLHSRTGVRRGRFLLVAQRCARCGQVEVRIGRAVVGKVDLRGRSGWHTFTLRSKRTGKLRVVTTSHRRVTIDGFYSLP